MRHGPSCSIHAMINRILETSIEKRVLTRLFYRPFVFTPLQGSNIGAIIHSPSQNNRCSRIAMFHTSWVIPPRDSASTRLHPFSISQETFLTPARIGPQRAAFKCSFNHCRFGFPCTGRRFVYRAESRRQAKRAQRAQIGAMIRS